MNLDNKMSECLDEMNDQIQSESSGYDDFEPSLNLNKGAQAVADSKPATKPFDFSQFSLNGSSAEMIKNMEDEKYVFDRLAIKGQMTAIYAKPNVGKTLIAIWMLINAVRSSEIDGCNVHYINADDNHKGLATKLQIAEKNGFQMLAPGYNDFKAIDFLMYLSKLNSDNRAHGVVIILDTLKKFTDIMDKKKASSFGRVVREFVAKGGTVIMLAHTNKNRDLDGKVVFSGTSDIVDDVDCAYMLDVTGDDGATKTVLFENIKSRGDVAREIAFSYTSKEGASYSERLESVKSLDNKLIQAARVQSARNKTLDANADVIIAIKEAVEAGYNKKTDLVKEVISSSGISRRKIIQVLKKHAGRTYEEGHRWYESPGDKNTKTYHLIFSSDVTSPEAYQNAKEGF